MADDREDLAAKGRATRAADKARTAKKDADDAAWRDSTAETLAARRLSPLAGSPLRFLFSLPAAIVWGTSLFVAFPYFRYFVHGGPIEGGSAARGVWTLDPARDGYALFYVFLVATAIMSAGVVWRLRLAPTGRRAMASEAAWAAALPFPLLGYPHVVGAESHRFKLQLHLEEGRPPAGLADVVRGVDGFARLDGHGKIEIDYPRDAAFQNAQRLVGTVHALVDAVFLPLHAKTPIANITFA